MKTSLIIKTLLQPKLAALVAVGMLTSACQGLAQDPISPPATVVLTSALDPSRGTVNDIAEAGASSSLPDSPDAAAESAQATNKPSKRVLGIIPNYRSVGIGAQLPPQTVQDKFKTAFSDTVDPAAFVVAGLLAGYNDARRSTPEFHGGAVAYGRYYWHSLADQTVENIAVEFVVPSLAHEDTRFYTLGTGGAPKRIGYALSRAFMTRSDAGKKTINLGELLGAGAAAAISSRYYPASQRDFSSVLQSYGISVGIDTASFVLREFDSDISRALSRKH